MGAFLIVAWWVIAGFACYWIATREDKEQRREREAREQGQYPPVRTLASRADTRMFMSKKSRPPNTHS